MLQDFLDWLAGTPKETTLALADVKPGRIKVEGKLRCEQPVAAAIGKSRCAGYLYHATYMVGSRMRGYIRRTLRKVLVYGEGLSIELEGGSLPVVPRNAEPWSNQQHLTLVAEQYEGFEALEKVLREGARVGIVGNVKCDPATKGLVLYFNELHLLDERGSARRPEPVLPRPHKSGKKKASKS